MDGAVPVLARHVALLAHINWPVMFRLGKCSHRQEMNHEQVGERPLAVSHSSGWRGNDESYEASYEIKWGRGSSSGVNCWMTRWFPSKKRLVLIVGSVKPYKVVVGQRTVCLFVSFCEFLLAVLSGTVSSPDLIKAWKPVTSMAQKSRSSWEKEPLREWRTCVMLAVMRVCLHLMTDPCKWWQPLSV
jgi:hypothetical protein